MTGPAVLGGMVRIMEPRRSEVLLPSSYEYVSISLQGTSWGLVRHISRALVQKLCPRLSTHLLLSAGQRFSSGERIVLTRMRIVVGPSLRTSLLAALPASTSVIFASLGAMIV